MGFRPRNSSPPEAWHACYPSGVDVSSSALRCLSDRLRRRRKEPRYPVETPECGAAGLGSHSPISATDTRIPSSRADTASGPPPPIGTSPKPWTSWLPAPQLLRRRSGPWETLSARAEDSRPLPREDPSPGRTGRRHPQDLATPAQAPMLDHPHHQPGPSHPLPAPGQLRLRMEKAQCQRRPHRGRRVHHHHRGICGGPGLPERLRPGDRGRRGRHLVLRSRASPAPPAHTGTWSSKSTGPTGPNVAASANPTPSTPTPPPARPLSGRASSPPKTTPWPAYVPAQHAHPLHRA